MDLIRTICRIVLAAGWVRHRGLYLLLAALSSAVIGWIDYITTDDINLSFVYLLPVFVTTLAAGRGGGFAMALACAVIKVVTDVASDQVYAQTAFYAFNCVGLWLAFSAFALLLDMLRTAYERECQVYRRDGLTGLGNRQGFADMIASLGPDARPLAFLLLDIDDFKRFNREQGEYQGDKILQQVGRIMHHGLPSGVEVYRVGGDDFVAALPLLPPEQLRGIVERLQAELRRSLGGKSPQVECSVCLLRRQQPPLDIDPLLQQARAAIVQAKEGGRHGVIALLDMDESSPA